MSARCSAVHCARILHAVVSSVDVKLSVDVSCAGAGGIAGVWLLIKCLPKTDRVDNIMLKVLATLRLFLDYVWT